MYTVELECEAGHCFEGWYDSVDNYEAALNQGELSCPVCDSEFIMRRDSAQTLPGRALMDIARKIKNEEQKDQDRAGNQYFKLFLD